MVHYCKRRIIIGAEFCGLTDKDIDFVTIQPDNSPSRAAEEDDRTWWRAAGKDAGEWLMMDLGDVKDVRGIQINFADDRVDAQPETEITGQGMGARQIDGRTHHTRWILEGSADGETYATLMDKSAADTNLPHDFIVLNEGEGQKLRYIRLTILETPFDQNVAISSLRVFGKGGGDKPSDVKFEAERLNDLDMRISMHADGADGYNICWGHAADKLYHSCMFYPEKGSDKAERAIGALITGREVYVRVDAFNENGITHGEVMKLK